MTSDVVMDALCRAIVGSVEAMRVQLLDDYDESDEPHGYNPAGEAAYCTVARHLIRASARVACRATVPLLPAGYNLVHGDELRLYGPDIDSELAERVSDVLGDAYGRELAEALHPAIEPYIGEEYRTDWRSLKRSQIAWVHSFKAVFSSTGAHIEFTAEIEDR